MTKRRVPGSSKDAVTIILATLGAAECSRVTGKSESLIRKWGDPDSDVTIPLDQAMRLDAACVVAGSGTPILDAYTAAVRLMAEAMPTARHLVDDALQLAAEVGRLSDSISTATAPDGPAGSQLSHAERMNVLDHLQKISQLSSTAGRALQRHINQ